MYLQLFLIIAAVVFLAWCISRLLSFYCEKHYGNPDDAKKALGDKVGKTGITCMFVGAAIILFSIGSDNDGGVFLGIILFAISIIVGFSGGFLQVKGEEKERIAEQERIRKETAEAKAREEARRNDPINIMFRLNQVEQQFGIRSGSNDIHSINTDRLRNDMMNYYGTAMHSGSPMAQADLIHIQRASDAELIKEARKSGFDLNKYAK